MKTLLRSTALVTLLVLWTAVPRAIAFQTANGNVGSATQTAPGTQSNPDQGGMPGTQTQQPMQGPATDRNDLGSRPVEGQTQNEKQSTERTNRPSDATKAAPEAPRVSPPSPFQLLVQRTLGEFLPLFGRTLFQAPSTFAALPDSPPPTDYVISTGDEILVRIWGPLTMNEALTVDRAGDIYLPQVGIVHVAGLPYSALAAHIQNEVSRVFKNFNLAVNLGRLHSIQIFVTGQAQSPGTYTVSSLSTLVNAVFASGGPSPVGSMRRIELRRDGRVLTTFDFYELLVHGDKSKDTHLLPGDVVFIPSIGAEVALGGQVKVPAIYEVMKGERLSAMLDFAGGPSTTASSAGITLQHLVNHEYRETLTIPLTPAGLASTLNDGDVLVLGGISNRFENTVTIRGNLANPGRFAWHPGMRLSDIIPAKAALLTQSYWDIRNAEGGSNFTFEASPSRAPSEYAPAGSLGATSTGGVVTGNGEAASGASVASRVAVQAAPVTRVTIPSPEIDWFYAVIERTDTETLHNQLLPFNLGKLVMDHDPSQNLPLLAGDVVTIFSQSDFDVPQDQRTRLVRIEGEVISAGVYNVQPGETLQSVVLRAGGLSAAAYVYGAQFTRESTRALQQQGLNEYADKLSDEIERSTARQALSVVQTGGSSTAVQIEERMLAELRSQRATGRIVLDTTLDSQGVASLPSISLENGDVFIVPSRPAVVSVIGAVNNRGAFLFREGGTVKFYLGRAGGPDRESDFKNAFVIRANGSVLNRKGGGSWGGAFNNLQLAPGDTLVVPAKLFRISPLRTIVESSAAFSQIALVAAAISLTR